MFKRFQVIDLYDGGKDLTNIKEWVHVEKELPKERNGIFKVRLSTNEEVEAYYCSDSLAPMMKYFKDQKPSKWWSRLEKIPLYDVTHWGKD